MADPSIDDQLAFLREVDRLKNIVRQSPLIEGGRRENSAEHSWHLALYAWVLEGSASLEVDVTRVIRMLLLHDIVEIDAGDTPIHGPSRAAEQLAEEEKAAQRIFGILPRQQAAELLELWREFEAAETADAQFAKALDRLQPLITNIATGGGTWVENNVTHEQVLARYGPVIRAGAPSLWAVAERMVAAHFRSESDEDNPLRS